MGRSSLYELVRKQKTEPDLLDLAALLAALIVPAGQPEEPLFNDDLEDFGRNWAGVAVGAMAATVLTFWFEREKVSGLDADAARLLVGLNNNQVLRTISTRIVV